ncbi:YkgJ family cysteine cluster protein [Commensalibacter oyaizuii]|uniref:YkgJ family cysteine cluster protein n=1 Tax=Commensalibacter oyaizuii TaxID=3043873 RepID=UPI0038D1290C
MTSKFPCYKCGCCCQHVNLSEETLDLDRGDGVCQFYEESTRLCSVYKNRPEICQIDLQYKMKFSNVYTWNQFVELNLEACKKIQLIK